VSPAAAQAIQLLVGAVAAASVWRWRPPPRTARLVPLTLLFALLALLPAPLGPWLSGKEGLGEALTVGVLVALGIRGVREAPGVAVCAAALLLEELSWFQPLLDYPTPAPLATLGSTASAANLHNIPALDFAWRAGPVAVVAALAVWPRARRGLPHLDRSALIGLGGLLLGTALLSLGLPEEPLDEALELGLVLLVWLAWRREAPATRSSPS